MQDQTTTSDPSQRSTQFVPDPGGTDTTSGEALLVAAYLVMWLLLLFFVWTSWRRQQGISKRITQLEKVLAQGDGDGADTADRSAH